LNFNVVDWTGNWNARLANVNGNFVEMRKVFQKFVGVSPAFALHTATLLNAQLVGLGDETGSIEPGKSADFLITDSDPLQGFETIKDPYMVVMRGMVFRQPKAKKYKQTDDLLDRYMP